MQQVRTVFTETLTTAVGDSDTLGENQLLHVRAVQTKLSGECIIIRGREEEGKRN